MKPHFDAPTNIRPLTYLGDFEDKEDPSQLNVYDLWHHLPTGSVYVRFNSSGPIWHGTLVTAGCDGPSRAINEAIKRAGPKWNTGPKTLWEQLTPMERSVIAMLLGFNLDTDVFTDDGDPDHLRSGFCVTLNHIPAFDGAWTIGDALDAYLHDLGRIGRRAVQEDPPPMTDWQRVKEISRRMNEAIGEKGSTVGGNLLVEILTLAKVVEANK